MQYMGLTHCSIGGKNWWTRQDKFDGMSRNQSFWPCVFREVSEIVNVEDVTAFLPMRFPWLFHQWAIDAITHGFSIWFAAVPTLNPPFPGFFSQGSIISRGPCAPFSHCDGRGPASVQGKGFLEQLFSYPEEKGRLATHPGLAEPHIHSQVESSGSYPSHW